MKNSGTVKLLKRAEASVRQAVRSCGLRNAVACGEPSDCHTRRAVEFKQADVIPRNTSDSSAIRSVQGMEREITNCKSQVSFERVLLLLRNVRRMGWAEQVAFMVTR